VRCPGLTTTLSQSAFNVKSSGGLSVVAHGQGSVHTLVALSRYEGQRPVWRDKAPFSRVSAFYSWVCDGPTKTLGSVDVMYCIAYYSLARLPLKCVHAALAPPVAHVPHQTLHPNFGN
jgi:hypothetical protein